MSKISEHMNAVLPVKVLAQRYAEDAQWTTDCGIVRVKAGQWHVNGDGYEATLDDDEFREAIRGKCEQCGASVYEAGEAASLKEENRQLRIAIASHLGPSDLTHDSPIEDLQEACRVAMDTIYRGYAIKEPAHA